MPDGDDKLLDQIKETKLKRMQPREIPPDVMDGLKEKLVNALLTSEYDPRSAHYSRRVSKVIHRLKAERIGQPCRVNVQLAEQIMSVEMGVDGRGLNNVKDSLAIICSQDSTTIIERVKDKKFWKMPRRKKNRRGDFDSGRRDRA